jgi:hypothetical protein
MATTSLIPLEQTVDYTKLNKDAAKYLKSRDSKEALLRTIEQVTGATRDVLVTALANPLISLVVGYIIIEALQETYRTVNKIEYTEHVDWLTNQRWTTSEEKRYTVPWMPQLAGSACEGIFATSTLLESLGNAAPGLLSLIGSVRG